MPGVKKYRVELSEAQRDELRQMVSRGQMSARKVKRALALLGSDQGLTDEVVANGLSVSTDTVRRARKRFAQEGLHSALNERPRPGQKRKLDGSQEAHLMAIACSDPPEGHTHWTIKLLAGKAVELGFVESISDEAVRQMLKKTNSSRGRGRSGASRR